MFSLISPFRLSAQLAFVFSFIVVTMMASSQVEIATTTTSPFGGCAVHNRRDPCFQNNINNLVISNDGSRSVDLTDLWVHRPQWQSTTATTVQDSSCKNDESNDSSSINKNDKCNDSNADVTSETRSRKDKWARAREMVVRVGKNSGDGSGQKSPNQCSEEVPSMGGVSSLVQKWRGFEAGAQNCNCKGNFATAAQQDTAISATTSNQDNASSAAASQENARPDSPAPATTDDDPFGDWESDKTPLSGQQSSLSRDSDATESERLRVADIIRKLTEDRLNDVVSDSPPRIRSPSEQSESRSSSSPVVISPRIMIRGRQAYNDLLMQMERDRRSELDRLVGRKAVSKFSHRGRIQALLRVRFLRRGLEAKECYRPSNSTPSESKYAVQSAILHFRERVNVPSAQNGSIPSGSCCKEVTDNNPSGKNSSPANQKKKGHLCEEISKERTDGKPSSMSANQKEKENQCQQIRKEIKESKPTASNSCATATRQEGREIKNEVVLAATDCKPTLPTPCAANQKEKNNQCQETTNSKSLLIAKKDNIQDSECSTTSKEHEDVDHTFEKVNDDKQLKACPSPTCVKQEANGESSNNTLVKLAETIQGIEINSADSSHNIYSNSSETTKPIDNLLINVQKKEEDSNNHWITETNYNLTVDFAQPQINQDLVESDAHWISNVSHPDIGWEELHSDYHQEEESHTDWIDEVSRPRSDWEGLRLARYQEMLDPFSENEEIRTLLGRSCVSSFLSSGLREKIDILMITRTQGPQTPKNNQKQEQKQQLLPEPEQVVASERQDEQDEGEDFGDYYGEYEEAEGSVSQHYNEYADQITSSHTAAASPQNQGHELIDHSYPDTFPSTQQSPSNSFSQDHGTSYNAHPAIEVELMYDLRGHMEQLHQEMSELRKSIKCCMDMQIKLESSIKKEVAIAVNGSDGDNGGRDSVRRCRVCRQMQVDSLLYRCGHMCTCFKCAHELQWSSGKCPICSAPIVDIVRANSNCS